MTDKNIYDLFQIKEGFPVKICEIVFTEKVSREESDEIIDKFNATL